MNLNSTKYYCRTCLEDKYQQKHDLLSLYSVDVNSGMQICEMILQTSQVQVKLFKMKIILNAHHFILFRFTTKQMRHQTFASIVDTSSTLPFNSNNSARTPICVYKISLEIVNRIRMTETSTSVKFKRRFKSSLEMRERNMTSATSRWCLAVLTLKPI